MGTRNSTDNNLLQQSIGRHDNSSEENQANTSSAGILRQNDASNLIQESSFFVQTANVGRIIGRGGAKIKELATETRAHIKIGQRSQDDDGITTEIILSGSTEAREKAKEMIIAVCEYLPARRPQLRGSAPSFQPRHLGEPSSSEEHEPEKWVLTKSDYKMTFLKVEKSWHDILECPICREYMSSPIHLCVNGHSICHECKGKTDSCPVCRGQFSLGRNFALEQIAEKSSFPCVNAEFGCKETVFISQKNKHEKICHYRQYECLPGKLIRCKWKGRKMEILDHIEKEHPNYSCMIEENSSIFYEMFSMQTLIGDFYDNRVISVFGEIFWYRLFFSEAKNRLYISVHYIGPHENCSKYFYKLHFKNSEYEVLFSTKTHPDTTDIQDLIEDEDSCFCLKNGNTRHFLDNGTLKFNVKMIKASY